MNGYNFGHDLRTKLAEAAVKYLEDDSYRAPLNEFIMSIQQPYIEIIADLTNQLRRATDFKESEAKIAKRDSHV